MNYVHSVKYLSGIKAGVPSPILFDALLQKLDVSPSRFKSIRLYGEAGKSNLACFLESIMRQAGLPVGRISMPHGACRGAILQNGNAVSEEVFAQAASAVQAKLRVLSAEEPDGLSLTPEECLTAMGLWLFSQSFCGLLILEYPAVPSPKLLSSFPASILSVLMPMEPDTATTVASSLTPKNGEILSAVQSPEVSKIILDRCAAINSRLTIPLKNSFYRMDYRCGGTRFFYQGKEYTIPFGADYCAANATMAIETFLGLVRHGVILPAQALAPALASTPVDATEDFCFRFLSFSPPVIADNATTGKRLEALFASLDSLSDQIPHSLIVWYPKDLFPDLYALLEAHTAFTLLRARPMERDNLYRQVKNAVPMDFLPDSTLLLVGPKDFTGTVSRVFDGFLR